MKIHRVKRFRAERQSKTFKRNFTSKNQHHANSRRFKYQIIKKINFHRKLFEKQTIHRKT